MISWITAITILLLEVCVASSVAEVVRVRATNSLDIYRPSETIVLKWKSLTACLPSLAPESAVVREVKSAEEVVSQAIDIDGDGKIDEFVFQWNFEPKESVDFIVAGEKLSIPKPQTRVYARYVKERMDDFAWENDRVAFRMYGPALKVETHGSGVDVWTKRVRHMVINKWYASGDYHEDHGEGLDCFKVGTSRGCGGIAICVGKTMYASEDYSRYRIIANGPIRAIFELFYDPWDAGAAKVSEVKRITIDAGQNLCRFESTFATEPSEYKLDCAIGLVKRAGVTPESDTHAGWISLWGPTDTNDANLGYLGLGIVFDRHNLERIYDADDHLYTVEKAAVGKPMTYYAGFGWTKSGDFQSKKDWNNYLARFARCVNAPIKIVIGGNIK